MAIDPSTVAWINQQVADLAREAKVPGSPRETDLLQHWFQARPKMLHQLMAVAPDLPEKLAFVLVEKQYQAMMAYLAAGMAYPDARQTANQDWLMMEPEQPDREENQPLSALTSISTTRKS